MAGYSDFSFTALWARIGGAADATLAGTASLAPRGVVVELPGDEREALVSRTRPFIAELEALRLQTYATVDKRARALVPLAGGTVFIGLVLTGQGFVAALIFGFVAAMAGWFLAMGNRSSDYQNAVKSRIAAVTMGALSGLNHAVEPATDLARLRNWRLFPDLQAARTRDQIEYLRDGRTVRLSEMSVGYAPTAKLDAYDHTLTFTVIEATSRSSEDAWLVLTPKDAPPRLLAAQAAAHRMYAVETGDADFDAAYSVYAGQPGDASLPTGRMRSAILELATISPAGRPYLAFTPEYVVVLFPTQHSDLAFHVPPYWIPLDASALVAQFASDLALRNRLMDAVLALPDSAQPL